MMWTLSCLIAVYLSCVISCLWLPSVDGFSPLVTTQQQYNNNVIMKTSMVSMIPPQQQQKSRQQFSSLLFYSREEEIAKLEEQLKKLKEEEEQGQGQILEQSSMDESSSVTTTTTTTTSSSDYVGRGPAKRPVEPMQEMMTEQWKASSSELASDEGNNLVVNILIGIAFIVILGIFSQIPIGQEDLSKYSAVKNASTGIDLGDLNPLQNKGDF